MYFNKRYKRTGSLFQGRYRATNVINKDYLLDITRYIHRNPLKFTNDLINTFSSYAHYLNSFNLSWVNNNEVFNYFSESSFIKSKKIKNYKDFVEKFRYINEKFDISSPPLKV
jgi:transcriptional regulatory protein LevR